MEATISYHVQNLPHPWDESMRARRVTAWCLVRRTTPEYGETTSVPVAIFDRDSEALTFQGHVLAAGLDGALVHLDPTAVEYLRLTAHK